MKPKELKKLQADDMQYEITVKVILDLSKYPNVSFEDFKNSNNFSIQWEPHSQLLYDYRRLHELGGDWSYTRNDVKQLTTSKEESD